MAVGLLTVLIGGRAAVDLYVEALWFSHLEFGRYFWRLRVAEWSLASACGLLAAGFLFANLYPLARSSPRLHIRRRYGNIEIAEVFPRRYLVLVAIGLSLLFGWSLALYVGREWTLPVLQYLNAPDWGRADPVFARDLSFYVFELPVLSGLHFLFLVVLIATIVFVTLGHSLMGAVGIVDGKPFVSDRARWQLGFLGALVFFAVAWGFWLGMQELLWTGHGVTGTLGYTDAEARFTARRMLVVVSVLAGAATLWGVHRGTLRHATGGLAALAVGTIALNHVYPTVVQKIRVEPNELERERRYLAWDIAHTRMGFGLDRFDERSYELRLGRELDEATIARATSGLPLWDPRPLRATYNQFQGINPYYSFVDVDYDRYGAGDAVEQVAVSVREIDIDQLPSEAQTWQNLHLSETYAHGLGLVMSPAARTPPTGEPLYYVSGIPPTVAPDAPKGVEVRWPEVYFGEKSRQYVLVRDTLAGEERPRPRGVLLDSFVRKASFAWSFADKNLLLSQELQPATRILYERTVQRRIARLAPFLILDPDIYPVLVDGRVVWIQDAYTVTPYFPLSQRVDLGGRRVAYVRNSVKVSVDAVTGATTLYVVEPDDPVMASYLRAFPTLFRTVDDMPAAFRRHLRYPAELLLVQARVLRAYHVRDPRALYHQLDLWDLPVERYREGEELVRPYYVVMPDPAAAAPEPAYLSIFPLTARGRDNMRGFLVARSDVTRSSRVTLYRLPSEQVLGPRQVKVQIDQDPVVSQQFTLWQQRGSRVIRGHPAGRAGGPDLRVRRAGLPGGGERRRGAEPRAGDRGGIGSGGDG